MSVSAQQQIQILHVDDDPAITDLTAQFLERESDRFTVETATSADDGLQILSDHTPDCIVSDYNMPGMNGLEFLRTVRETRPDLPFILFTGKGSEEVASDAIAADVTHYLQKGNGTERYELLANRIENAVEQHRAQTELQARERRFKALLEHSPDRLFILDEDGHYQFISPSMERIMGFSPEEMEGKASRQFIHPEDRKKVADVYQQVLANPDEVYTLEYRVRHKDGSWRWVESRERNRLDDPVINGVVVNSRDITERKQSEQQLRCERDRFETLFETLHEPAILVSGENEIDATISRVNPAFEETFGYEEPEIVDEHINDLIVPPDRQEEAEQIDQENVAGELISTEIRRQTADGELRDFLLLTSEFATHSEDDPYEGFAIYADITDQREQADRFNALTEAFPDLAFIIDEDGRHIEQLSSPSSEHLLVTEPDDIIGARLHDLFPSKQADRFLSIIKQTVTTDDQQRIEYELETNEGIRWFEARIIPYPSTIDGKQAVACVARDITKRKHREQELELQRDRFELLFETFPEPTVLLRGDREPIIRDVNPAFEDVFGYDGDDIRGENLNDLIVSPEKREEAKQIDSRHYEGELYTTEVQRQTADGQLRDFLLFATDRIDRGDASPSEGFVIYADITERKESQRKLQRQNERLNEFASIVAHDLRNPLNVVDGHLELAREECDSDHLDAVDRAHDRMAALIDDLLTLAQEGESVTDFDPIALADLIPQCWENVMTSDATLRLNIDRRINGDESRLQQLFENLFRNGIEHGGDDVTVTVGLLDDEDGFYVADDGPGIPDDKRVQIFERGYSTTETGTGFGLVIVQEIAEAHGWDITATNSDDGGARFEITGVEFDQ